MEEAEIKDYVELVKDELREEIQQLLERIDTLEKTLDANGIYL